jgi:Ala-tRNA(Pro) deacylase
MAAVEHESGRYVAKPVIMKVDDHYLMCVLPASHRVDVAKLRHELDAQSAELAEEGEIAWLFPDCELGAEPPFGSLYELPTVMDRTLENDDHILFQAGTHEEGIRMRMADYRRLVNPPVLDFGYRLSF